MNHHHHHHHLICTIKYPIFLIFFPLSIMLSSHTICLTVTEPNQPSSIYFFYFQLDTHALRKYALAMAKIEQGEGGISPYLVSQVPSPPRTARSKSARAQGRRSYRKDKQGKEKHSPVLVSFSIFYLNLGPPMTVGFT